MGGAFGFGGDSSSVHTTKTATDQAQQNGGNSATANGQGVVIGKKAIVAPGAGNIKAAKGAQVNINYGTNDSDLANQFLSTIGQLQDSQSDQNKTLTDQLADVLKQQTDANTSNQQSEATSGLTTIQKTLGILGALTVAAIIVWPKKHK